MMNTLTLLVAIVGSADQGLAVPLITDVFSPGTSIAVRKNTPERLVPEVTRAFIGRNGVFPTTFGPKKGQTEFDVQDWRRTVVLRYKGSREDQPLRLSADVKLSLRFRGSGTSEYSAGNRSVTTNNGKDRWIEVSREKMHLDPQGYGDEALPADWHWTLSLKASRFKGEQIEVDFKIELLNATFTPLP